MRTDRARGFILPTSLLVLTLLTVMLTAAFVLVSAEYRSTDNAMAGTRAMAMSQAAMQTYFATNRPLTSATTNDSVRYFYSGGYADVVAWRMRAAVAPSTASSWMVRSSGTATNAVLSGQIAARRSIGQMAILNPSQLRSTAAMMAVNGLEVTGTSSLNHPLTGENTGPIPAQGCTASADSAALLSPYSLYDAGGGNPPNTGSIYLLNTGSLAQQKTRVYDSTHVDWPQVISGNFSPDYTTVAGLPSPGNTTWEVGFINGDVTIPGNGNLTAHNWTNHERRMGVLIVTGNVTMANDAHWAGVIIAGGRLLHQTSGCTLGCDFLIEGYVVTGLNCITGTCPAPNSIDRWYSVQFGSLVLGSFRSIRWNECLATLASQSLTSMVPVKNTFTSNWAAY